MPATQHATNPPIVLARTCEPKLLNEFLGKLVSAIEAAQDQTTTPTSAVGYNLLRGIFLASRSVLAELEGRKYAQEFTKPQDLATVVGWLTFGRDLIDQYKDTWPDNSVKNAISGLTDQENCAAYSEQIDYFMEDFS